MKPCGEFLCVWMWVWMVLYCYTHPCRDRSHYETVKTISVRVEASVNVALGLHSFIQLDQYIQRPFQLWDCVDGFCACGCECERVCTVTLIPAEAIHTMKPCEVCLYVWVWLWMVMYSYTHTCINRPYYTTVSTVSVRVRVSLNGYVQLHSYLEKQLTLYDRMNGFGACRSECEWFCTITLIPTETIHTMRSCEWFMCVWMWVWLVIYSYTHTYRNRSHYVTVWTVSVCVVVRMNSSVQLHSYPQILFKLWYRMNGVCACDCDCEWFCTVTIIPTETIDTMISFGRFLNVWLWVWIGLYTYTYTYRNGPQYKTC